MARWAIRHETKYRYSTPVAFAPHLLRLTPRADAVATLARTLQIWPNPLQQVDFDDELGNRLTRVTFGPAQGDELLIVSQLEVETPNVYEHAAAHAAQGLPRLPWSAGSGDGLAPFRQRDESPEVAALARELAREVGYGALEFFDRLNHALYSRLDRQIRVEGRAQTPVETLTTGRGACRDLTVLFLAVCRNLGVAGRFVSGYQGQEASPDGRRHLHAWPEVFVPPLGWLGWDPTHGVRIGTGHVALSAAPDQAATMPVEGGFYFNGPSITSTLDYSIYFAPA
jgi:transglutaminase-like putative cysteine protease